MHMPLLSDADAGLESQGRPSPCRLHSWSQLYAHRQRIAARFGKIFSLPIVKRVNDVIRSEVRPQENILEVGAGERGLLRRIQQWGVAVVYKSMDVDPWTKHDYRDLEQIDEQFDLVVSLEVIEHLPFDEIQPWLTQLAALLRPGGRLILSTPNTYYPPAYLRDATHCTPLCYDELGGFVEAAGLRVDRIVRVYHDPVFRKLMRRYVFGWLFRLIGIDFARQIVLVARREG